MSETITNQEAARKDILIVEPDDGEGEHRDIPPPGKKLEPPKPEIKQQQQQSQQVQQKQFTPPPPKQQQQPQPQQRYQQQATPPHLRPRKIVIHNPIYSPNNLLQVAKDERFVINELVMKNKQGVVLWSTFFVTLFGNQQGPRFASKNHQLKYTITKGDAWFYIDNYGHAADGIYKWIRIEPGQFHHILNRSKSEPLEYNFEFPGKLDMKRILEEEDIMVE